MLHQLPMSPSNGGQQGSDGSSAEVGPNGQSAYYCTYSKVSLHLYTALEAPPHLLGFLAPFLRLPSNFPLVIPFYKPLVHFH